MEWALGTARHTALRVRRKASAFGIRNSADSGRSRPEIAWRVGPSTPGRVELEGG
jgi:hypothetical protein